MLDIVSNLRRMLQSTMAMIQQYFYSLDFCMYFMHVRFLSVRAIYGGATTTSSVVACIRSLMLMNFDAVAQ
jgi:hypothetical protein